MERKPHILFVANTILGWSTYARQLTAALEARTDLRATVVSRRPPRWAMQALRRHADGPLGRVLRPFDPISAHTGLMGRDIRRAVALHKPDVVHVAAHWPGGALAGRDGPPMTLALDATRPAIMRDLALSGWTAAQCETEARLCRAAAHLFPMSRWAATSLREDFRVAPDRITVQPPSLDPGRWPNPAMGSAAGVPQVLFVGNDLKRKGAYRLAQWVEGPLAGRCHLHVVSTDTRSAPQGRNITFHGAVAHEVLLKEMLPRMDLFCLPTRLDMSPFVVAEAAAAGLPVVASRMCSIPDMVLDGETGLLVDPQDDAGFVAAISRLLDHAEMRQSMGQAALRHAARQFDGGRNFAALIDSLVGIAHAQRRAA